MTQKQQETKVSRQAPEKGLSSIKRLGDGQYEATVVTNISGRERRFTARAEAPMDAYLRAAREAGLA